MVSMALRLVTLQRAIMDCSLDSDCDTSIRSLAAQMRPSLADRFTLS